MKTTTADPSRPAGIILCAGLGTRLRPHTDLIAKPALPVMNIPMLSYPLYYFEQAGIQKLVVNTHHRPESIRQVVKAITRDQKYSVDLSHEAPEILGSGGALWQARKFLETAPDFFLANGDSVAVFDESDVLARALDRHRQSQALATLLVCHHPQAGHGLSAVWADPVSFAVKGFGTRPPDHAPDAQPFHFIGFQIFSKQIFKFIPEGASNILYDVLVRAIAEGQPVRCEVHDQIRWFETGNEFDYLQAHEQLFTELVTSHKAHGNYGVLGKILDRFSPLWNHVCPKPGVFLHRESGLTRATFPTFALVGPRCQIHPDAQFSKTGFVVLGEGCEVREPCLLENVVMATGTTTSERGHLSQTLVSRAEQPSETMH